MLRSKSDHTVVAAHRELIQRIGVTGGSVETRIADASKDATYLLAEMEVVSTHEIFNVSRAKLEAVIHRVFGAVRLELTIKDRFSHPV